MHCNWEKWDSRVIKGCIREGFSKTMAHVSGNIICFRNDSYALDGV